MMMIDQRESERDKNPPTFSAASFVCLIALSREYANTPSHEPPSASVWHSCLLEVAMCP